MTEHHDNSANLPRRRFIGNGIKLTLLAGIIAPLEQACNPKTKTADKKKTKDKSTASKNTRRRKWNVEKLLINAKSNVIHLPTAAFYVYYDEIKNPKDVNLTNWENHLQRPTRLNKNKSGNILEVLSIQKLKDGIDDRSLTNAADTLAIAFTRECENAKNVNLNLTNYRLHELMLQLIVLNNTFPSKWQTFNDKVRKPEKLGKRQSWMADENSFGQRVKYIQDREAEYKSRLLKRASKHNLT